MPLQSPLIRFVSLLLTATALSANAADITVKNGDSIQDAVAKAKPGDVILIKPGEYKETVYIDKDNITLRGIIEEGKSIMDEFKGTAALDAGLVSAAQAVEHYEIARYGTLKTWAQQLGLKDAVTLLDATLQEEVATDQTLSALAEADVNRKAA